MHSKSSKGAAPSNCRSVCSAGDTSSNNNKKEMHLLHMYYGIRFVSFLWKSMRSAHDEAMLSGTLFRNVDKVWLLFCEMALLWLIREEVWCGGFEIACWDFG